MHGKSNGRLDGRPRVISRHVGKGRITYIGAWLDDATAKTAVRWMKDSGVHSEWPVMPAMVELSLRDGAGGQVAILVNISTETRKIDLPGSHFDLLRDHAKVTSVQLMPYSVAILGDK